MESTSNALQITLAVNKVKVPGSYIRSFSLSVGVILLGVRGGRENGVDFVDLRSESIIFNSPLGPPPPPETRGVVANLQH